MYDIYYGTEQVSDLSYDLSIDRMTFIYMNHEKDMKNETEPLLSG